MPPPPALPRSLERELRLNVSDLRPGRAIGPPDLVWRLEVARIRLVVWKGDRDCRAIDNGPVGRRTIKSRHIDRERFELYGDSRIPRTPVGPAAIQFYQGFDRRPVWREARWPHFVAVIQAALTRRN